MKGFKALLRPFPFKKKRQQRHICEVSSLPSSTFLCEKKKIHPVRRDKKLEPLKSFRSGSLLLIVPLRAGCKKVTLQVCAINILRLSDPTYVLDPAEKITSEPSSSFFSAKSRLKCNGEGKSMSRVKFFRPKQLL